MIKSIKNLFKLAIRNEIIKIRIITDIKTLFEQEDDCFKPIRVANFWNDNFIEYEINSFIEIKNYQKNNT